MAFELFGSITIFETCGEREGRVRNKASDMREQKDERKPIVQNIESTTRAGWNVSSLKTWTLIGLGNESQSLMLLLRSSVSATFKCTRSNSSLTKNEKKQRSSLIRGSTMPRYGLD